MPAKTISVSLKNQKYFDLALERLVPEGGSLSEVIAQALRSALIAKGILKVKKVKKGGKNNVSK